MRNACVALVLIALVLTGCSLPPRTDPHGAACGELLDLSVETSHETRSLAAAGSSPAGVAVMVGELDRFATDIEGVETPSTLQLQQRDLAAAIRNLAAIGRASLVPVDPDDRLASYGTDPSVKLVNALEALNTAAAAVDAACSDSTSG